MPSMRTRFRTHTCGELRDESAGIEVSLVGWVESVRDHGGVLFFDLRDRYGKTQCMVHPERQDTYGQAKSLRSEFCVSVTGKVAKRPAANVNPRLATGAVEVPVETLEVFNSTPPPPLDIDDAVEASPDLRLRFRYLDLRRGVMQRHLVLRHRVCQVIRRRLDAAGFVEIETPILTRSTPEGARDYLVPSRVNPGTFFALPQSPQLFKQLLMVSGFDRYFQIVRCFRDEDLRADRQPEFTQLDLEMSFVDENDVQNMIEEVMADVFKEALSLDVSRPFPRMTWQDAMDCYGNDRPDTRFELHLKDVTGLALKTDFRVFREAVEAGGVVRGLTVAQGSRFSRKEIDEFVQVAVDAGAKGLSWFKCGESELTGPAAKFMGPEVQAELRQSMGAAAGDLMLVAAGPFEPVCAQLSALRLYLGRKLGLIPSGRYDMLWVVDFPLMEWDAEAGQPTPRHHPFTSPRSEDADHLESDPLRVRARAYDLILNGSEIGGGSIRIHDKAIQSRIFTLLGIGEEEARSKFGFLLDALSYGAPPHGGIALGLDRILMILAGATSIRDVIAFPKTMKATCLMTQAPSPVDDRQLRDLGIRLLEPDQGNP